MDPSVRYIAWEEDQETGEFMAPGGNSRGEEPARRDGGGGCGDDDGGRFELSLRLGSGSPPPAPAPAEVAAEEEEGRKNMTIFYSGRVCAVDLTELQAMAIISMANQEMEQIKVQYGNKRVAQYSVDDKQDMPRGQALPASPVSPAAPPFANSGLSMKRSLQRFLQKRKTRGGGVASPYAGPRPAQWLKSSTIS